MKKYFEELCRPSVQIALRPVLTVHYALHPPVGFYARSIIPSRGIYLKSTPSRGIYRNLHLPVGVRYPPVGLTTILHPPVGKTRFYSQYWYRAQFSNPAGTTISLNRSSWRVYEGESFVPGAHNKQAAHIYCYSINMDRGLC